MSEASLLYDMFEWSDVVILSRKIAEDIRNSLEKMNSERELAMINDDNAR